MKGSFPQCATLLILLSIWYTFLAIGNFWKWNSWHHWNYHPGNNDNFFLLHFFTATWWNPRSNKWQKICLQRKVSPRIFVTHFAIVNQFLDRQKNLFVLLIITRTILEIFYVMPVELIDLRPFQSCSMNEKNDYEIVLI